MVCQRGSFECPHRHPPWSPVSIGKPAPKIHQWTIYFCRWGFGWVDKAQCFRSARRFDAAGSSPDFSRVFHDMALLGLCLELSFNLCKQAGLDLVSARKDLDPRTLVSGDLRHFCMTVRCAAHCTGATLNTNRTFRPHGLPQQKPVRAKRPVCI